MKFFLGLLFLFSFVFSPIALAEIKILNQSEIWGSKIDRKNNQFYITGNENNARVMLVLAPNKPAYLQVVFPQAGYNFDDNTVVTLSINNYNIKLSKNLSNTNSQICVFQYMFKENELKNFIHELTSKKEADIELNDRVTSIALNGTSRSVSAVLKYIDDNNITSIVEPFNNIAKSKKVDTIPLTNNNIPIKQHNVNSQQNINDNEYSKLFHIIGYFLAFILIYKIIIQPILRKRHFNNQVNKALQLCFNEIDRQSLKLFIKRDQLIYKDDYGTMIYDKWFSERENFIKSRIEPLLYDNNLLFYYPYIEKSIQDKITEVANTQPVNQQYEINIVSGSGIYHPNMNPLDYEIFCAKKLREIGWEASTTKASGDQGADVVATKNGIKLVLQCKLYSKPVSNTAVQQINTAKTFYHADYAAVVSNADFTIGARQIASSTKVVLLHHDELQNYANALVEL